MGVMTTFQRARTDEQREIRRRVILDTAATMLRELPVSEVSLNELSRRVGLAKSNVLRYFESREAVLLELLELLLRDVLTELGGQLPGSVGNDGSPSARTATVATTVAAAFAAHPMLCELLSARAGILERNVSVEAVKRYRRGGDESLARFTGALGQVLPELGESKTAEAARIIIVLAGALWTHTRPHPPQAVREAQAADPSVVFLPDGYAETLERTTTIFLLGLLAD